MRRFPKLLTIDRTPMMGGDGRRYLVIGEGDVGLVEGMEPNRIVLSVHSPGNHPMPYPKARPGQVWHFEMHDVQGAHEIGTCRTLTDEQAAMIVAAVRTAEAEDGTTDWVLQCEAGMSRSAGLCQALAQWFGDDEVVYGCAERYSPNQTVRRRLYKALSGRDLPFDEDL